MTRDRTARLFVAVDPPQEVCEQLSAWARAATGQRREHGAKGPLRLLDPELLHLTLCFLGGRPVEEIEAIGQALRECAEPVGELSIGAPLWLPPRRPRVLAVEVHDPSAELARLHQALLGALAEAIGWHPEQGRDGARGRRDAETHGGVGAKAHPGGRRRRFHPHITLARMREGAAPRERELTPTPPLAFTPQEIVLYRSWLAPDGASYEALERITLLPG